MNSNSVSLQKYLPNGKISTRPGEITDQYITAVSRLYLNRSDGEQEYMIEETGIVERSAYGSVSECYAKASKMAYQNAVSRIMDIELPQYDLVPQELESPAVQKDEKPDTELESSQKIDDQASSPDPETVREPVDEPSLFSDTIEGQNPTVKKVDLNLVSAASLKGMDTVQPEDEGEILIKKARETKITILGKAHDCYDWPAGKILDELPDIIVKFAHRYSGDNTIEKEALLALYPEAVRICEKKAS